MAGDSKAGIAVVPAMPDDGFGKRLADVRQRIAGAAQRAGRDPAEIRLLPVSKTVPAERVRAAFEAGLPAFGENKVQEARLKAEELADLDIHWSIIGHLQTNKARYVARFAHEVQSLDSVKLAAALDRRLQREGRSLDVLVQVNSSGEESKYGLPPGRVAAFLQELPAFTALRVRGLMTLALFSADTGRVQACFQRLRGLRDRLRQDAPSGVSLDELSMGMSGDFELAILEGATVVRVGQAIFGPRALPDSYYWPTD